MPSLRIDLYDFVTQRIITALESGTPPWVCPWRGSEFSMAPANASTGRPYRGINVLLLNMQAMTSGYSNNRWMTFAQAKALGAHVRKGEEGSPVVFFKILEPHEQPDGEAKVRGVPLLKRFTVFNSSQIDGLPEALSAAPAIDTAWEPCEAADDVLEASGALIKYGGERAFYAPSLDLIKLPEKGAFLTPDDFYSTALHELTHWTGHSERCARDLEAKHKIDAYAFEELVAEMGSAFLCSHCRLPGQLQHASYIGAWLKALRGDKRLIFKAASLAQKAADFLLLEDVIPAGRTEEPHVENRGTFLGHSHTTTHNNQQLPTTGKSL